MFIWVFHRVSGLLLIFLLGVKFFTSFFLMTKEQKPDCSPHQSVYRHHPDRVHRVSCLLRIADSHH